MGNVEARKNKEGYELNLNTLIYSELLMSNVRFLVTNQICRVLPWKQVHIDKWDKTKQQVKGKDEEAKSLNNYLKAVKAKLYQKEAELLGRGFIITAKLLCEAYQEKIESLKEKSLFEVFTEHNHEQEKLIYSFTQAIS